MAFDDHRNDGGCNVVVGDPDHHHHHSEPTPNSSEDSWDKVTDLEVANAVLEINPDEPKTFEQAWFHPDPHHRKLWREAIMKEIDSMELRNVWTIINKHDVPPDRTLIDSTWALKIKRNLIY